MSQRVSEDSVTSVSTSVRNVSFRHEVPFRSSRHPSDPHAPARRPLAVCHQRLRRGTSLAPARAAAQSPAPTASAQGPSLLRFDIPAGPLDEAIRAFEATSGLVVEVWLPADTLHMMQSPGVSGMFGVHAALETLLDATSLVPTRSADGVITVDVRGMTESLEVTGRLPRVESSK